MKKIICTFLIILALPFAAIATEGIPVSFTQPEVLQADEPAPELVFFPRKISRKDILVIIRYNNEATVTSLTYTVTAGTAVLTGSFKGQAKEMKAYVNLVAALKDQNPETFHVVVKDNTDRVIIDTDLPLVTLQ